MFNVKSLYFFSSGKIKASHFHSTRHFIDDLCAINDGGELGRSFRDLYPKELEQNVEIAAFEQMLNPGDHATFLNFDIIVKEGTST